MYVCMYVYVLFVETLLHMLVCFVCLFIFYVCICASKSSTLNKSSVCGCSSYIYQEEQLLAAARGGQEDELASLLDQGVDIQCKDGVRNERIG